MKGNNDPIFDYSNQETSLKNKTALVTGASAGIGMATALQLATAGANLVLVARRQDRLESLKATIQAQYPDNKVTLIPISVTASDFPDSLKRALGDSLKVDILINNAGLAKGIDPIVTAKPEDWSNMISTNLLAAVNMVRLVLPGMIKQGYGHIVNLGSIAGHLTYEGGSVYCATKHALRAFTQSLRLETCAHNVKVTLVSPGLVNTEFSEVRFNGDKAKADKVYQGMQPLTSHDIARQIIWALQQPAHVNLDDIIVMPQRQGLLSKVHRDQ